MESILKNYYHEPRGIDQRLILFYICSDRCRYAAVGVSESGRSILLVS